MYNSDSIVICVLDDNPSQLETINRVLSMPCWQTHPFTDPDTFLQYAADHSPDFAILDLGGLRARGLEIRARLREVSPVTRTIIALKPYHNPAREMLSENELVDLIKQYVGESRKRCLPERSWSRRRELAVGLRA